MDTACALAAAYSHPDVVSMLVDKHAVRPWLPRPCYVCLLCTPATLVLSCDRRENHREDNASLAMQFSAVHAACAVGNLAMVKWLVATFPQCRGTCLGDFPAEVSPYLCNTVLRPQKRAKRNQSTAVRRQGR